MRYGECGFKALGAYIKNMKRSHTCNLTAQLKYLKNRNNHSQGP